MKRFWKAFGGMGLTQEFLSGNGAKGKLWFLTIFPIELVIFPGKFQRICQVKGSKELLSNEPNLKAAPRNSKTTTASFLLNSQKKQES